MNRFFLLGLWFFVVTAFAQDVKVLTFDQPVAVAGEQIFDKALTEAESQGAKVFVMLLNTPGGFPNSTRAMIAKMKASQVPVVVYVAPEGAQAASAGTFLVYGAHIAAMAPNTTIGAASVVSMSGEDVDDVMQKKVTNDILAFARSLAKSSGRSQSFIENAINDAVSVNAAEAKKQGVIEFVAKSIPDLLSQIKGKTVMVAGKKKVLDFDASDVSEYEIPIYLKVLSIISDPVVTYLLLLGGIYGILFELYSPGAILPGVVGVMSLILASYGLHLVPFNYVGLLLILLGVALSIAELMVPSGLLGLAAVIAIVLGGVFLFESTVFYAGLPWAVVFLISIVLIGLFLLLAKMVHDAHQRQPLTGVDEMIGAKGTCSKKIASQGEVILQGVRWQARSESVIEKGQSVRVVKLDGLVLVVTEDKEK